MRILVLTLVNQEKPNPVLKDFSGHKVTKNSNPVLKVFHLVEQPVI